MTHDQLSVAQAEAFTILRDLMHMKADDPRPQRIINTIKHAAMAILRLKPVAPAAAERRPAACSASSIERKSSQSVEANPPPASEPREADPTAHLSDAQFIELLTHLPDLNPTNDKRRLRLARYLARFHLGVTPEIKEAIRARAAQLTESLVRQRAA